MTSSSILDAPLSPHWAFVVQLREGTPLTPGALHGRVEHWVSGRAACFASLEELWAFIAQVLAQVEERPPCRLSSGASSRAMLDFGRPAALRCVSPNDSLAHVDEEALPAQSEKRATTPSRANGQR